MRDNDESLCGQERMSIGNNARKRNEMGDVELWNLRRYDFSLYADEDAAKLRLDGITIRRKRILALV